MHAAWYAKGIVQNHLYVYASYSHSWDRMTDIGLEEHLHCITTTYNFSHPKWVVIEVLQYLCDAVKEGRKMISNYVN